jgi:3-phosphoshikimate 1-carboxyvinyltransferase
VEIETYGDHRMAMGFMPLALQTSLLIHKPEVVAKSYPSFWEDCIKLGFRLEELD